MKPQMNVSVLKLELHDIPIHLFDKSFLLYIYIYIYIYNCIRYSLSEIRQRTLQLVLTLLPSFGNRNQSSYIIQSMVCYICRLCDQNVFMCYINWCSWLSLSSLENDHLQLSFFFSLFYFDLFIWCHYLPRSGVRVTDKHQLKPKLSIYSLQTILRI